MTLINIDLDSTCNDLWKYIFKEIYAITGKNYNKEILESWNIGDNFPPNIVKLIGRIVTTRGFYFKLPVKEECIHVIKKLHNIYDIVFVTAIPEDPFRYKEYMEDKLLWVEKFFPFIDLKKQMCFLSNKKLLRGDVLIDDSPEHLSDKNKLRIAFEYPYNRHLKDVNFVKSWLEIAWLCNKLIG